MTAARGASTDVDLVRAAMSGDVVALGSLLEQHRAWMYRDALTLLRDPDDAADAVQDAFVLVLRHLGGLREPAAFPGWLRSIVRSVCLMRLRRVTEVPSDDLPVDRARQAEPSAEEAVERLVLREWVWDALDALPETLQVTALLRYLGPEHSYHEIAAITGVPVGTVRSRLHQVRSVLAERLLQEAADVRSAARTAAATWSHRFEQGIDGFNRRRDVAPLVDIYAPRVAMRVVGGPLLRGRPAVTDMLAADLADHVGYRLAHVVAGRHLAVIGMWFVNPADDPEHCPPAVTQVITHRDFEADRVTTYFATRRDDAATARRL